MQRKITAAVAALLFFIMAGAASAATIQLTGVGNSIVTNGVYAGFYTGTIDGLPVLMMCDDFFTHSHIGQTWTADANDASALIGGAGKFGPDPVKYSQVGWLFSQAILPAATPTDQGAINLAIWNIMTPGAVTLDSLAQSYLTQATSGAHDASVFSGMMVYTPNPLDVSQEMLAIAQVPVSSVPVPAAAWLFASGILGLVAVGRSPRSTLAIS